MDDGVRRNDRGTKLDLPLEDRMVKWRFRALAEPKGERKFRILTKRPITANDDELAENPRARSAKLRVLERVQEGVAG